MTEEPPATVPPQVLLPDDLQVGVWAHAVAPSANAQEIMFDFDFVVQTGQAAVDTDDGRQAIQPQYRVVSRVRMPPAQMFEIMKALSALLADWERRFGPVPRPGVVEETLFPPEEPGDTDSPDGGPS